MTARQCANVLAGSAWSSRDRCECREGRPNQVKKLPSTNVCHVGGCQNYGPFLGLLISYATLYLGDPNGDHNFDNHSCC